MRQSRKITNFLFSHYFSDGLRVTLGALLPSLLFAQVGQLQNGIIVSLGAICVSLPDYPGTIKHRRNGMLFCILFIILSAFITDIFNGNQFLLAIEILGLCFFFSMFVIYGARASAIGTAALLVMILNIDQQRYLVESFRYIILLSSGGVWYFLMSMALTQIRPYRLAQQELSQCIIEITTYLRYKADFYDPELDIDETYKKLISQQILVHQQQDAVREHLFNKNMLTMNITKTVRQLILVFVDATDLFEQSMANMYDFRSLRDNFADTEILKVFRGNILKIADELENVGYYIRINDVPNSAYDFQKKLEKTKLIIDGLENSGRANTYILKKILVSQRNMVNRVRKLYTYLNRDEIEKQQINRQRDLQKFVSHQDFDLKQFRNNLTFSSSTFRHAVRVSIVMLIGFTISRFFQFGHHGYWILLTMLVILKPAFSLTKQRNFERLLGTIAGGIIGALIVYFIKEDYIRFGFMLCFMLAAYSFQRLKYVVSVLFMTPYLILMFSFLGLDNVQIAQERIIDTFIGSAIAFAASYVIFPSWEHDQLKKNLIEMLTANYNYLLKAAESITGRELNITAYKLVRKEVYVSSANLGSAFQRMLSEPKSKQRNISNIQKFVVLNHSLSSYTASLMATLQEKENRFKNPEHVKKLKKALAVLSETIKALSVETVLPDPELTVAEVSSPFDVTPDQTLIEEQLNFIGKISADIQKVTARLT